MARTTLTADAAAPGATQVTVGASTERRDRYALVAAYTGPALNGKGLFHSFQHLFRLDKSHYPQVSHYIVPLIEQDDRLEVHVNVHVHVSSIRSSTDQATHLPSIPIEKECPAAKVHA